MSASRRDKSRARLIQRATAVLSSLPGVTVATEGSPALEHHARYAAAFRVGSRRFAWLLDNHHGDERLALWLRTEAAVRETLMSADPGTYFIPPYLGRRGWMGVCLDRQASWEEIEDLVEASYRSVASPRLLAQLGG